MAGVLDLVLAKPDRALSVWKDAVHQIPDSSVTEKAQAWSNLAAAYLVGPDDPVNLVAALDATELALHLKPRCTEALYNRALALEKLFLLKQAQWAWREHLAVETDPGWSGEARAALARLSFAPRETWDQALKQLRQAVVNGDAVMVTSLTGRFRQEARTLAEEDLLPVWATLLQKGRLEQAKAELAVAREIGLNLAQLSGEHLLADTVAGIDAAAPKQRQRLAQGLLAFRRGLSLALRDRRFADATAPLEQARTDLLQAGSPFAAWPSYLLIRCTYQSRNATAAIVLEQQARDFFQRFDAARYPVIAARARWTLGTSQMERGRPAEALASYRWALTRFQQTRESLFEASMQSLIAGAFDQLGDVRSAWQHHLLSLRGFAVYAPDRVRLELVEAAFAALDAGYAQAAVRMLNAAVEIARQEGDPEALTTILLNRAKILNLAGFPGAENDLAAIWPHWQLIEDPSLQRTLEDDLILAEGAHFALRDPARALQLLSAAFERHSDRHFLLPSILSMRAAARTALGQEPAAEKDLRQAIEILEEERGTVPEAEQRASFLSRVDSVYDALVLLLEKRGKQEEALDISERRRGRVLLDWLSALPQEVEAKQQRLQTWVHPQSVRELQPLLAPGIALLVYEPLEDRLLIWVVRRETVELRSVAIPAREITQQVQELENAAALKDSERVREDAGRLHQSLLAPIADLLRPDDTLIFVPRGSLYSVPFSLLFDARTGRYLIQDRAYAVSPSLNAFVALQPPSGADDFSRANVLAITNPAFDHSLSPGLASLPGALTEGRTLQQLYGSRAEWISGEAATRDSFLDGLRSARLLHFGGHARANPSQPLLSSLLLSPRPERGDSGVLYARDLLGPRGSATELAVLSACGSAAGATQPGEGVAGLVWPLLARGVPRVVATLWSIEDTEAAELTSAFYRHLHAGVSPLRALRRAQLERLAADRSFGWAAFQLYGGST